jgi:drug/metabolite transporter (DMT)-like permease
VVHQRRRGLGYLMVVAAALLFALNGTISKIMLIGGMPAEELTELRSTGAFVALLALVLATRPSTLRVSPRELPLIAAYGILGVAATQWLYFVAIKRLPVGIALLLEFTAPLLVALWARFVMHEPVRRRVWLALVLSLAGLAMVAQVWGGLTLDGLGVAAGAAAAFVLALYFLLGEHMVRGRDPVSLTCLAFGFAALFWAVVRPWWRFPFSLLHKRVSLLGHLGAHQVPLWWLAISLIVLGTVVPFTLSIASLGHLRARQVGLVGMVEPVAATVIAYLWLGEDLGPAQIFGGTVVIIGVILAETARTEPATVAVVEMVP